MSTITREQLHERAREKVKSLEFAVTQTAFADSRAELEEELELARIALASLEAEAVCVIDQSNLDYLKSGSDADVWPASRAEMGDVLLYRSATPAPVSVPAAMEMDDDFDSAFEHGKAVGWNAYRAAMLQSFGNSEQLNSPVIQDGWVACVERMPSAGEQVLAYRPDAPESNDPLIKMATYVGGSAHGHGFDCYCKPTHWMPLPAAPKQEA
ncbi:hypothetical protein L414_02166 [Enterobacter hormaechei subsp. hoffmannii UCICRE 3]|uniref:DUF551 domain-containing protein n=1 Tax=Enterobacter hormaechei TaxID=158836 RepID=UPI0003BF26E0|nr:DUF551 domain-containing protein [Enterobacter hormaechei]ESM17510.1 hypothetical protein L414_02166 [Enterobacter hormaechei subsp. hoffmannii UCICRE 3]